MVDDVGLTELQQAIRGANSITRELMSDIAAASGARLAAARDPTLAHRIEGLIENEAWIDAALALLAFELPQWKLRRLVYEDGEWICSLSKHCQLPDWLDDVVEAHHAMLPLAILAALVEARRSGLGSGRVGLPRVPRVRPSANYVVCCDNFA